ncbi:MAG: hypothetical protein IJV85_02595 [Clostridia bacterium]|nr:hypothetical protein [Clostridia bacterium]
MSILGWFLKPKKKMAKKNTKYVRIRKYTVTSHAQNRTADPSRNLKKKDMVINLLGKESKNSEIYTHKDETTQYDRVNNKNRTVTHITKKDNHVTTIQRYHNNKKGEKEAYKNFK